MKRFALILTTVMVAGYCTAETTLPLVIQNALNEALAGPSGEYDSLARYEAIMAKHGKYFPYVNISRSEEMHIEAIAELMRKYGMTVPPNPFSGKIYAPATLKESALLGAKTEEENVAMYDRLLKVVDGFPDITRVFDHLRFASAEHHLWAFKRAADTGGHFGEGGGPGRDRGRQASTGDAPSTATLGGGAGRCCGMRSGADGQTSATMKCSGACKDEETTGQGGARIRARAGAGHQH